MYTLTYKVTTSTCDENGRLKLYSALQMMQDCSELWINSERGIKKFFTENHRAQLLVFRQVDIARVPTYGEDLSVTSTVYGMKPMFGFRNTFIYDKDGNPCYKTWSMGAFVDRESGKLDRIPKEVIDTMHLEEQKEMDYQDRHISMPTDGFKTCPIYTPEKNDFDYNKHVNNANYMRLAVELLPNDFAYNRVRVEYKSPVRHGETIRPELCIDRQTAYIRLNTEGQLATTIEFSNQSKSECVQPSL